MSRLPSHCKTVYRTTLNLAVANGGATDQKSAFQNTWNQFSIGGNPRKDIQTWDQRKLYYYRNDGNNVAGFSPQCATNERDLRHSTSDRFIWIVGLCHLFSLRWYCPRSSDTLGASVVRRACMADSRANGPPRRSLVHRFAGWDNRYGRAKSCGKAAPCKLLETGVPTALGNPATEARFPHFATASNNNKLDDRDHFLENATASVASLRGLITSTPKR